MRTLGPEDFKKAIEFAGKIKGKEDSTEIFLTLARKQLENLPDNPFNKPSIFEVKNAFQQIAAGGKVAGVSMFALLFTVEVLIEAAAHCEEE